MNYDLTTYLKIFPVLDQKFCAELVEELANVTWKAHSYYCPFTDTEKTHHDDLKTTYNDSEKTDYVMRQIWTAIAEYQKSLGFSWFNNWTGYSIVRYNYYEVGTRMQTHCDHIHSLFDGTRKGIPILTVLGALSDDFEGGELIFWEDKNIDIPVGSVAVFPSNFLYPHKVLPITKGTRYSFVSWVW